MNRSFEVLSDIYKPLRYTLKGHVTILESTSGTIVLKPKENDLDSLFSYLRRRNFSALPKLIDSSRDGVNVFSYIEEMPMPKEQKAQDLVQVMASLHQKTSFYKNVSLDTYQEIYENIVSNIQFLQNSFHELFDLYFQEVYPSPSHYLFLRNASKVFASLEFSKREVDDWFELVKKENKQRVSYIHNQLCLDHFLKGEEEALISWEKSKVDSPVLDFVHFYQAEYFDLDFETLFQKYQEKYPWNEEEKKLFFILISLPFFPQLENDEMKNCEVMRNLFDYVFKTEQLIRPYYAVEQDDE